MNPVELREPDYFERVDVSPLLLFRYSALTFNGHRIHYDRDYAHDVEGYPGLVVHGPLQATLMLHLLSRFAGQPPKQFSFKGVAPLTDASKHITVNCMRGTQKWNLWCMDQASEVTMTGIAT
jgi:3-methylfumaryl-CoA hydratase